MLLATLALGSLPTFLGLLGAGAAVQAPAQATGAPAAAPAPAQAPAGEPSKTGSEGASSAASRDVLGAPLVVNGKRVPDTEIERFLCFSLGAHQVDQAKFQIILEQEIARRKEAGEDVSKYAVSDEEADRVFKEEVDDFELDYPTLDVETEISRAYLSPELYREQSRQTILFDKLFMPDDPDQWPPLTREVLIEFGGPSFIDDAKTSYEARKKRQVDEGLDRLPPDDPIYVDTVRSVITQALNKFVTVEVDPEVLDPDVLMTVESQPIQVQRIWSEIAGYATPDLLDAAKRFVALEALYKDYLSQQQVEQQVEEEGEQKTVMVPAWLSFADFEQEWTDWEHASSFNEHMSNNEMFALQVLGFPSLDAFGRYMRISESYKRTIADQLADDELMKSYLPNVNPITGAAQCNVEVILVSAYDFANVRWKDDGWAGAKQRADELKQQLDQGADWTQTLELHSEFWDPPMPERHNTPVFSLLNKGKFGSQTRNRLINYMGESEYLSFLYGPSITDHIFFEQPVGSIEGPFKGPKGYYITRLLSRGSPNSLLDMNVPVHRQLVETYYLRNELVHKSEELLAKAQEEGRLQGL